MLPPNNGNKRIAYEAPCALAGLPPTSNSEAHPPRAVPKTLQEYFGEPILQRRSRQKVKTGNRTNAPQSEMLCTHSPLVFFTSRYFAPVSQLTQSLRSLVSLLSQTSLRLILPFAS